MGTRDQSQERAAVARLLAHLTAKGWTVAGVNDGGEINRTQTADDVLGHVFGVDESSIRVYKHQMTSGNRGTHGILIILGNADDGSEVVSDWTFMADDPDGFSAMMDDFLESESARYDN